MENYLHPEISALRKLSLPNGLQELMSDITREVLRAQPIRLYDFIKDYLAAMLVTRENLTVANRLHEDICYCLSEFELDKELEKMELSDEDIKKVSSIINDYFSDNLQVKECSLIQKITKAVQMTATNISELQQIIRESFMRHSDRKINFQQDLLKCSSNDEIAKAVENTLNIYKKIGPCEADYNRMAEKIQAAYRGYGVTRNVKHLKYNLPSSIDSMSKHENDSKQSSSSHSKENEREIEDLYIPKDSVNSKVSLQTHIEEETVLEEIIDIDDEILDEYNYDNEDMIGSNSEQALKTVRNVSFNANEQELDNYDYQNATIENDSPEEYDEIIEVIEEEVMSNDDIVSILEDCTSIYDINGDEISDLDIEK